jgi:uncharacterized protein YkwD
MRRFLVLFSSGLAAAVCAAPAHALPTILSAGVSGKPLTEDGVTITVVARDPKAAVNAVRVDFGDGEGGFGESACRIGRDGEPRAAGDLAPGRKARFEVPFAPQLSGEHAVTITVVSGACGATPKTTSLTIPVSISLPDLPTLPLPVDLPPLPPVGLAARACLDAGLLPSAGTLKRVRKAALCLINQQRGARGLGLLHSDARLRRAATRHSRDMLRRHFFDHQGPNGPALAARLERVRFWPATASENIGAGQGAAASAATMIGAWMNSSGHRTNILTPAYRQVGLGIVVGTPQGGPGATYTADFGLR